MLPIPFNNPDTYPGHSGVDFGQAMWTPVPASGTGRIHSHAYNDRAGYGVWVSYDGYPDMLYCHFPSHEGVPAPGTRISEGSTIGYVGSTGNSTGPHLHVEVEGYATTNGFWNFFDPNRVVGGGSGGNTGWNRTDRSTEEIQRFLGVEADGIWGQESNNALYAWQHAVGLVADGIWGELSDALGFPLDVDGQWGPRTIAKFQYTVGATIDGEDGPETTRAFQRKVGITTDGDWGRQSTLALQLNVGANPDGEWGPETVRRTQEFLNVGKKFVPKAVPEKPKVEPAKPRTPIYPEAIRGWDVPLGREERTVEPDMLIIHHTATTSDNEEYFKEGNSRSSAPTWYVKRGGAVIEMISPDMKPSATGAMNNRSWAIETQNTSGAPEWGISSESHWAIVEISVWLHLTRGLKLDRDHIIGHNEAGVNATECPGPSMNIDWIVEEARATVAELENPEEPETPEEPTEPSEPVEPAPEEPETPGGYPVPDINLDHSLGAAERLGSILPKRARDVVYIIYGLVGVAGIATTQYLAGIGSLAPGWLIGGIAAYASIGPFISLVAKANLSSPEE